MRRVIKSMEEKYLLPSLDMVEAAFTDWADAQEGKLVRSLVEEIRGFVTSADHGITAHESVGLPAPECLMVKELTPGGLDSIRGVVRYDDYASLCGGSSSTDII